jgi:hypothetical protein
MNIATIVPDDAVRMLDTTEAVHFLFVRAFAFLCWVSLEYECINVRIVY